jgi:uncharacterized protein YerC
VEAWISEEQRVRISELIAEGATSWRLQQETGLSRFQVLRCSATVGEATGGRSAVTVASVAG